MIPSEPSLAGRASGSTELVTVNEAEAGCGGAGEGTARSELCPG